MACSEPDRRKATLGRVERQRAPRPLFLESNMSLIQRILDRLREACRPLVPAF
ncbi:hypothetical protein CHELA1G11_11219 [Hyphomicrobiales bacterium]|nr:hypothetical protein CHELA1G11_11219 [Hyphomicrobiales bacterium]CAH1669298.1 hypothetical protein CHELA1G2_13090 [Hyphomicrobiales bacterium]